MAQPQTPPLPAPRPPSRRAGPDLVVATRQLAGAYLAVPPLPPSITQRKALGPRPALQVEEATSHHPPQFP